MGKELSKKFMKIIGILIICVLGIIAIRVYLNHVDVVAREIQNEKEITYKKDKGSLNSKGFYTADLKSDLTEVIKSKKIKSLTYEFEDENFSMDILVHEDDEGNVTFEIERIFSQEYDISARMNMKGVEAIEYRTGNPSESTVLKIKEQYNEDYFAMFKGNYYFMGEDIESISYKDEHFYYVTYNPDYKLLEDATACTKEIRNKIDGFDMKDYYYKYGKLNFFGDYYQKLASKKFTVQNKCDELNKLREEEKQEE